MKRPCLRRIILSRFPSVILIRKLSAQRGRLTNSRFLWIIWTNSRRSTFKSALNEIKEQAVGRAEIDAIYNMALGKLMVLNHHQAAASKKLWDFSTRSEVTSFLIKFLQSRHSIWPDTFSLWAMNRHWPNLWDEYIQHLHDVRIFSEASICAPVFLRLHVLLNLLTQSSSGE